MRSTTWPFLAICLVASTLAAGPSPNKPPANSAALFDEHVALLADEACTADCAQRCAAHQLTACLTAADQQASPAEWCKAGDVTVCIALARKATAPAEVKQWNERAIAWEARWVGACGADDPWACRYAEAARGIDHAAALKLAETGCRFGVRSLCSSSSIGEPDPQQIRQYASINARACRDRADATICAEAADRLDGRDAARAAALRTRGMELATAGCKHGGIDSIEPCEWTAAFATDPAAVARGFQSAVAAAEVGCKGGSAKACMLGAGLWSDKPDLAPGWTGPGNTDVSARLIKLATHAGDPAKARAMLTEACRLANLSFADSTECNVARDAGIDVSVLAPPSPGANPKRSVKPK